MTIRSNDRKGSRSFERPHHITAKLGEGGMGPSTAPWTVISTPTS